MNLLQIAATVPSSSSFTIWMVVGFVFLLLGVSVGEPTAASLGIAAIITAIASLSIASTSVQMVLWGVLAIALTVVLRGMVPMPTQDEQPDTEAVVSEMIPRGGVGWVSYEGSLWKARCQISDVEIARSQTVQVIGRHGLTLIVLPIDFPDKYDTVS
ncbi:MAG: NfeD family protein [Pegethrix bostrychoides GSE-TBD4-15B]|uniref:NfeD family protein n=1 Tax=Pegethrix bostrychoides GSE-TBD4-15B TaxID=2839662 RepID=A0A951U5Y0_9CYAN|nr:NfeD family protein [Pegethrix bostrychoides GSE-TBD4-15B]